jgi:hypothetical protein
VRRDPKTIDDGIVFAQDAGIEIDTNLLSDHDYFIIMRALQKKAIRAVVHYIEENHEAVSES